MKSLLLVALLFGSASLDAAEPTNAAAVRKVFSEYRTALLDGNGAAAADLVTSGTIAYYDEARQLAMSLPRAKLAELDFLSKLMVLRLRHEFTNAQLAALTGRELLAIGVKNGWISKSSVANSELAEVKVDGAKATASLTVAPQIPLFHFQKESGKWKLDLLALFGMGNAAMRQQVEKSGLSEEQFILRLLGMLSSRKVDAGILSGPTR
ncbi:MAG TPA: hypothetical protein VKB93_14925 [Thermoanaerobaculia bacterium]|nr:hypothetical protein [Thermoanaerobaculia bacterium]